MENISRAKILIEALPYIRHFSKKTVVIKYGGHAMAEPSLKNKFVLDVILMKCVGINPIIVHGGGPQINQIMGKMGIQPKFIEGQRVTDDETMSVVEMVLVGTVNKEIVGLINRHGGKAVGLSGRDGNLIQAVPMKIYKYSGNERPTEIIDIGRVGKVSNINAEILNSLESSGFIPIIAPVGVGPEGQAYNINADLVAGAIAGELKAEKLIILTDIDGVMDLKNELIQSMTADDVKRILKDGTVTGGMIPKLKSCLKALNSGVDKTHIIDGRKEHAILLEMFTDSGVGTQIVNAKKNSE
jgi:acetylglutamate kinase